MFKIDPPDINHFYSEFTKRMRYARYALKNSLLRSIYAALDMPGYSLFERALIDCKYAPNIFYVGWKKYTGRQNDKIPIKVFDDTAVVGVHVSIYDYKGDLIENDYALPVDYPIKWVYTVLTNNAAVNGCRLVVEATDWPENKTTKVIRIPFKKMGRRSF